MQLDLNLLTALDALLEEGSVTGAAARLHVTAPAVSRSLGRIRRATGDQILVRTGRTMTPTPRALALREEVHALVQRAESLLGPEHTLDLGGLERTFTLRCHDALTTAVAPRLLTAVHAEAPGVRLRLLAESDADTNDLRHGYVDLEVGSTLPELPELRSQIIGEGSLLIAARPGNPSTRGGLTTSAYAAALHVTVSRRGRLRDPVDEALESRGLSRRVVAAIPSTTAALHVARHSDILVAVPENVCDTTMRELGLEAHPIPLNLLPIPVVATWHHRYDSDKAHVWLRDQVCTAVRAICA